MSDSNSTPSSGGLTVNNLSFAYGKKTALDNVSFQAHRGRCTILLGPNGAGKSTLFSLVTRLYASKIGSIMVDGRDLSKTTYKALADLGVVFQQATLDMDMSVLQNLRYHAALHGLNRKQTHQRIEQELKRQGMYERRMEKIRQLNGGHRRRVEIARALLHEPSVILLDEPTVGLDIASRQAIVEHMHELVKQDNLAVLWATHLIDEVYENDHLIILHQGRICADGIVSGLLEEFQADDVGQLFQMLTTAQRVA
ncbi:MAG: ATP-binding cassette domain-containing protein [Gammaproteobacteria bacterium]|nr:ATP-binding cassette domain-containing protein [Gammaproteobacteria bacterium]